jgi:hypothetical protein
MATPHLSLGSHWIKADNQPPQDTPRFVVVLIAILALVNVSASVLMFGGWAAMINSMTELEQSIMDHLSETNHSVSRTSGCRSPACAA